MAFSTRFLMSMNNAPLSALKAGIPGAQRMSTYTSRSSPEASQIIDDIFCNCGDVNGFEYVVLSFARFGQM